MAMNESRQVLHCWKDYMQHVEEVHGYGSDAYWDAYGAAVEEAGGWESESATSGKTCFLEADHDGPHEWTSDSQISVAFVADSEAQP